MIVSGSLRYLSKYKLLRLFIKGVVEELVPVGPLFMELVQPIILTKIELYIMLEQTSLIISRVGVK